MSSPSRLLGGAFDAELEDAPVTGGDTSGEDAANGAASSRRRFAVVAGVAVAGLGTACFWASGPMLGAVGATRFWAPPGSEFTQDFDRSLRYDTGYGSDNYGSTAAAEISSGTAGGDAGDDDGSEIYSPAVGPTLFCFALVFPSGPEFKLMQALLQRSMGPFSCDGHNIYSNESVSIGTNPVTGFSLMTSSISGGALEVDFGSRWATALNTAVFVRVWDAVSRAGQYLNYDWSVKLDADCVFMPQRLRSILIGIDPFMPAYLENCAYGLHGPLEVVNRLAMRAFLVGRSECDDIYTKAITKEPQMFDKNLHDHMPPDGGIWVADSLAHGFGEDVYLQKCLKRNNVKMIKAHGMLAEKACKIQASPCTAPDVVAFHPFKEPGPYFQCVQEAQRDSTLTK